MHKPTAGFTDTIHLEAWSSMSRSVKAEFWFHWTRCVDRLALSEMDGMGGGTAQQHLSAILGLFASASSVK